jgi:predicted dienelactone hydrolase
MNNFTAHDGAACGFTHRDLVCEPADKQVFAAYLDATRLLTAQGWPTGQPRFVTVTPWPANSQDALRFEAIIYYAEGSGGTANARAAQRAFRDKTTDRIVLPIIRYSHNPTSQVVSFTYREADQDPGVLPR